MSWLQAVFVIDADQVEPVSMALEAFFAQAVTTENAGDDEYFEVAFPGTPTWQKVRLTALFADTIDLEPIIEFIQSQFVAADATEIPVAVSRLVDQDWERVWLTSFEPVKVGTDLWICPSWCDPVEPNARNIILDPGLAFGTGTHPTTQMCLNWLADQTLHQQTVLDYGSGTGILAIAALLSGAAHADAVDIDPLAVKACNENARRNNVDKQLTAYLPGGLPDLPEHRYQLVIANILADVIIELRDLLLLHLAPNGTILLTGILSSQAQRVQQSFAQDLEFDSVHQDQWCLLTGTKK